VDGTKSEVGCTLWTNNLTTLPTFLDKQMIPTLDQISTTKPTIKIFLCYNK